MPIDAIVTWVDGSDPEHVDKRARALNEVYDSKRDLIPAGIDKTRFEDNGEIEYCLRSIRRYAPWIRTIFLVTDGQCPSFLSEAVQEALGVTLVDHREIFKDHEDVLPTFNSLSIETMLYRIPNLASHALYFNDDFILLARVYPEDFFTDEKVVLRGAWKKLPRFGPTRLMLSKCLNWILKRSIGINRAMSVLQQIRSAQLAGANKRYFKVGHTPYPIRRDTLARYFESHPDALQKNIRYRFRSLSQYAATGLTNHLEIAQSAVVLKPNDDSLMICFNRDKKSDIKKKLEKLEAGRVRFLCIQSFEQAGVAERIRLLEFLKAS